MVTKLGTLPGTQSNAAATTTLQGIEVPAESINPAAFFAMTRRKMQTEYQRTFAGPGLTDTIELRKADILSGIHVRFTGQLVVTLPTGVATTTMRWPYDLAKAFRFTANGQSNLHNASGLKYKLREQAADPNITDRGVSRGVAAGQVSQGTLSMASENWGVGAGAVVAAGTYNVELYWHIPIAEDDKDLTGSIFLQTSSMDCTLAIDWEQMQNLVTTTLTASAALTGVVAVSTEKFSIPVVNGTFVLPDLSLFHSFIQTRQANGIANGDNELRIIGQGAGKSLLRLVYQVWNGPNAVAAPLVASAANFGSQGWRYSSNETPELFSDGQQLREWNERIANCDLGGVWGFLLHEFAVQNAFRDVVDMGQTSELRLLVNIGAGVVLNNPAIEYVQETVFAAGTGA